MAKYCANCGKKVSIWTGYIDLDDGNAVCSSCLDKATYRLRHDMGIDRNADNAFLEIEKISTENILRMIKNLQPLTDEDKRLAPYRKKSFSKIKTFMPTHSIESIIRFDDKNHEFVIGQGETADLFKYENIVDYEMIQNGSSFSQGSMGEAAIGGLLFGTVGAIIGAAGSTRENVGICNNLSIKITLRNTYLKLCYVPFVKKSIRTTSEEYKRAFANAQKCMSLLKVACDMVIGSPEQIISSPIDNTSKNTPDNLALIKQSKELLDMGAITQEEFDVVKKQLLNTVSSSSVISPSICNHEDANNYYVPQNSQSSESAQAIYNPSDLESIMEAVFEGTYSGLFFTVSDVTSITGRGIVVIGCVECGEVSKGDRIKIYTQNGRLLYATIIEINKGSNLLNTVNEYEGNDVGLLLHGISEGDVKKDDCIIR